MLMVFSTYRAKISSHPALYCSFSSSAACVYLACIKSINLDAIISLRMFCVTHTHIDVLQLHNYLLVSQHTMYIRAGAYLNT